MTRSPAPLRKNAPAAGRARQCGATLLEALVALTVMSFAAVGLTGLQARSAQLEIESYQRGQAILLLNDIAARLSSNRADASAYEAVNIGAVTGDCAADTQAARDLCEWAALLGGAAERDQGVSVAALPGALGCVRRVEPNTFVITITWHGVAPTGATSSACGRELLGDLPTRRAASTTVRIATLNV